VLASVPSCRLAARARGDLPNSITLTRIFSIPLLIWLLSRSFPRLDGEQELLARRCLSPPRSLTVLTDTWRDDVDKSRHGNVARSLADKLLIAAAFIALVQFNPGLVAAWVAASSSRENFW